MALAFARLCRTLRSIELGLSQFAQFVLAQDAVLIGIAARNQSLHAFGQFVLAELAVTVLVEGEQLFDDLIRRRADGAWFSKHSE